MVVTVVMAWVIDRFPDGDRVRALRKRSVHGHTFGVVLKRVASRRGEIRSPGCLHNALNLSALSASQPVSGVHMRLVAGRSWEGSVGLDPAAMLST